jgi:hypothetical protein
MELTPTALLTKHDYELFFEKGISYEQYLKNMEEELHNPINTNYAQYIPMNFQRSTRIAKTVVVNSTIKDYLQSLHHKINWLVISEHWCGDASQILPVLNAIALASKGMIDLRIVYRDDNPVLMDAHLTKGGKAIPKLIQLDTKFNINSVWGPRPNEAQKLVMELKSNPATAATYAEVLHKWYANDKTQSTQRDILKMLKIGIAMCPDCMVH